MRPLIEIVAATLLVICITATSAAYATAKNQPHCRGPELQSQHHPACHAAWSGNTVLIRISRA